MRIMRPISFSLLQYFITHAPLYINRSNDQLHQKFSFYTRSSSFINQGPIHRPLKQKKPAEMASSLLHGYQSHMS